MISAYQGKIPPATDLFVQGTILGQVGRYAIVLRDERERERRLVCELSPDEFRDVSSLYHIGNRVQAYGSYQGSSDGIPLLRQCRFADPTDNVVSLPPTESSLSGSQQEETDKPTALANSTEVPGSGSPRDRGQEVAKVWVAIESKKLHPQALDSSFTGPELISMDAVESNTAATSGDRTQQDSVTHKDIDGTVIIGCIVDLEGVPLDLQIIKSVTPWEDEAVLSAFKRAHFKAATEHGRAISWPFAYEVNLRFGSAESKQAGAVQ